MLSARSGQDGLRVAPLCSRKHPSCCFSLALGQVQLAARWGRLYDPRAELPSRVMPGALGALLASASCPLQEL